MAVAGCVFNLNRGNFSPITKFIGTALALRSLRTPARIGRDLNIVIVRATSMRYRPPLLFRVRVKHTTNEKGGERRRRGNLREPTISAHREKYRATFQPTWFREGNVLFRREHENRSADIVTADSI